MKTVGEGVETPSQLEMLKTLGCVEAQGYFFSQPQPAEKIFPSPEAATKPVPSIAA
jgi:EAL domain-containing protein (putative c-di-GMP-specific phosphodiesterase class I)